MLCTEFMARPVGSTFEAILPVAKKAKVGAFCWGLVQGKTQTHLPWDSWATPTPKTRRGPGFTTFSTRPASRTTRPKWNSSAS